MLNIQGLNQFYGQSHTLWDLDLALPEGECLCVMGRNGVGKTTLLKSIMGLLPVASGAIGFQDQDLSKKAAEERARAGIGYVPQGREIFPLLSVEENLETGLQARADRSRKIPERIYELFPVLHEMRHRRGGDLSGGQQQQLAIGRALALGPKLLILDEPTEGIQPNIVDMIARVIKTLNREEGLTILLVEQKLHFARAVADRFAILDRGSKVAEGGVGELNDGLVKKYLTV
ncbi:urea ABC transporter ATP-binding subunit UrtE [Alloalcanivorax mobilis]|uniref:urea ABC transporter ATP-binding subunit UrtE n=1 Tax=Alloalcanivorax mobilis TaxID=2019569 RepID=UPI000C75A49B|nr:urea ABC transporter ATP-binding subunit UrtE [Alloalcanivorax mobilis]